MILPKPFYMMRHGQTVHNAAECMAGSTDSPLTDLGIEQAYAAQKVVAKLSQAPVKIYHSHLSRARDTAAIVNEFLKVEMHQDPDLAEICAGDMEGKPWSDCIDIFDGWVQTPGGEAPEDFFTRIKRAKNKALEETKDGSPLIVCHGGVMRAFGALYGADAPAIFRNAHLYEFTPTEHETFPWQVVDYEICSKTKILKRNISKIYSI
ncbi:MAG: histidine phosphatase family protein [Alphaproteobacteria bacterium]